MTIVVNAMLVVLAIAAGVVVAVLIDMKSRSWRWAAKMYRLARQGARYLNREVTGLPRQRA